jgi:hypothetical protein
MRKTIVAALAAAGLGIAGLGGAALAAGTDDPTSGSGLGPAPTASATHDAGDDNGGDRDRGASDDPAVAPTGEPTTGAAGVGLARAKEVALRQVGGGRITKVERETEHGRLEWKIEVRSGSVEYDVRVDAATGAITRLKWEDEATDARGEARGGN